MSLVVKKFGAEWCAPCRTIAPILSKLAIKHSDVVFESIDIDDNPAEAQAYGVTAVPTIVFEKDGQVVETIVGLHTEASISSKIDQYR